MNPIFLAIAAVKGAVSIGRLFFNFGKVLHFYNTVKPIAAELLEEKRLPHNLETKEMLHSLSELVRAKVIDIPGVDEDKIADAIDEIETEIAA